MKYVFVIITLTGLMLQTFGKGLVLAEYLLNKEYIARVLCINKAEPKKGCNGQCHLMKQMEKETKQEEKGNAVKDKYEVIIAQADFPFYLTPAAGSVKLFAAYNGGMAQDPLHAVFHPPRV